MSLNNASDGNDSTYSSSGSGSSGSLSLEKRKSTHRGTNKNGHHKRQSQVFMAAQSLDLELRNLTHLKRMSIGSFDDQSIDTEGFVLSGHSQSQSAVPIALSTTKNSEHVVSNSSFDSDNDTETENEQISLEHINFKTPRSSLISNRKINVAGDSPVTYSDLYSFSESDTDLVSDDDSIQLTDESYEDSIDYFAGRSNDTGDEYDCDENNMSYNITSNEYLGQKVDSGEVSLESISNYEASDPAIRKRRSIHLGNRRILSNHSQHTITSKDNDSVNSRKSSSTSLVAAGDIDNASTHDLYNEDVDENKSIQSLLWVPASKHPNVKPENYIELVQNKLHDLKINTSPTTSTIDSRGNDIYSNAKNNINNSRKSSISRRPSSLRKSYTDFDTESEAELNTEIADGNDELSQMSPTTMAKNYSLKQITDELTKLSKNAGIVGTDAASLARSLSMSTNDADFNSNSGTSDFQSGLSRRTSSKNNPTIKLSVQSDQAHSIKNNNATGGVNSQTKSPYFSEGDSQNRNADEDFFASNLNINDEYSSKKSSQSSTSSNSSINSGLEGTKSIVNKPDTLGSDGIIRGPQRSVLQRSKFTTYRQKSINKTVISPNRKNSQDTLSAKTSPLNQTRFEINKNQEPILHNVTHRKDVHIDDSEEQEEYSFEKSDEDVDDVKSYTSKNEKSISPNISPNKDNLDTEHLRKISHSRNRHGGLETNETSAKKSKLVEKISKQPLNNTRKGKDDDLPVVDISDSDIQITASTEEYLDAMRSESSSPLETASTDDEISPKKKKAGFMSIIKKHIRPENKKKLKFKNGIIRAAKDEQVDVMEQEKSQGLQPAVTVVSNHSQSSPFSTTSHSTINHMNGSVIEVRNKPISHELYSGEQGQSERQVQNDDNGVITSETSFSSEGSADSLTDSLTRSEFSRKTEPDSLHKLERHDNRTRDGIANGDICENNAFDEKEEVYDGDDEGDETYGEIQDQHDRSESMEDIDDDGEGSVNSIDPEPPVPLDLGIPAPLPARKLRFEDVIRSERPNSPMQYRDSSFGFPLPPLSISTVIMFDQRLPVSMERAIYRLSHMKLSDSKKELRQQVLLSNFMYSYLNLVNHSLYLQKLEEEEEEEQQRQQQEQQQQQDEMIAFN